MGAENRLTSTRYSSNLFSIAWNGSSNTCVAYIETPDGRYSDSVRWVGFQGRQREVPGLSFYYYWDFQRVEQTVLI